MTLVMTLVHDCFLAVNYWPALASGVVGTTPVPQTDAELLGDPLQVKPAWQAARPLAGQQLCPAPPQA